MLAFLGAGEVHPGLMAHDPQRVVYQIDDVTVMQNRLRLALEQLRAPVVITGQPLADFMAELAAAHGGGTSDAGDELAARRDRARQVVNDERPRRRGCLPSLLFVVLTLLSRAARVEVWS